MKIRRPNFQHIRNAAVLISGTSVSQIILIASTPLLTRLYTPEDFAILAAFTAFFNVIGVFATGRFELAIIIPRRIEEAMELGNVCLSIALFTSLIVLVTAIFLGDTISQLLNLPQLEMWLLLLPIAIFFGAIFNTAQSFAIRIGNYSSIASVNVYRSLSRALTQLSFGILGFSAGGLVIGSTISTFFGSARLVKICLATVHDDYNFSWKRTIKIAKKYSRFPIYSAPAGLINALNANVLSFALPILVSSTALGYYALAMSVMGAPLMQISTPISQIFIRQAAEEMRQTGNAHRIFVRTLSYLLTISAIIFTALFFIVEFLFEKVFGDDWVTAGQYSILLLPLFATRFVVSPLSGITTLTDNRLQFVINVLLLTVSGLVLWVSSELFWEASMLLGTLSWALTACYLCYLPVLYFLARRGTKRD